MTDDLPILRRPLTAIGGVVSQSLIISVFMHEGYDRHLFNLQQVSPSWAALEPGRLHLVFGSRENPAFSWPVYALVEVRASERGAP